MRIFEFIRIALSSLHANKLRSSLTILGIIVGIFSIISISTLISMLQLSIEEGLSMLGKNTFQIQKWPAMMEGGPGARARYRNRKDITYEDYQQFKNKLVDAKYVGAEQWSFGKLVKYGNKETNPNIQICGSTPEAFPNNKWYPEIGRTFNNQDVFRHEKVIVIGKDIADALFEFIDPIGQEVRVDGHKLRVIGVFEKQGAMFGESQDNFAIMPITTFQSFYGKRSRSINITVSSYDRESYEDLIEKAVGEMRIIRKVPPGEENDFGIFSNQSLLTTMDGITSGVRIGAFVIAGIALLAAGVGIMNIMLVSVTERTKEIGIRKAIGARKSSILIQFLSEAIILCQIGGIVGIVLGVIVGNFAGSMLNAAATIPMDWVAIGVFMCVLIGVTFGTYPAVKAASLDPIEALRYE
jgi:putative ABC transport system permease protein